MFENWNIQSPVYVTRKTAHDETGSVSMSLWMQLLTLILIWLNIVIWGGIGLYEAVRVMI